MFRTGSACVAAPGLVRYTPSLLRRTRRPLQRRTEFELDLSPYLLQQQRQRQLRPASRTNGHAVARRGEGPTEFPEKDEKCRCDRRARAAHFPLAQNRDRACNFVVPLAFHFRLELSIPAQWWRHVAVVNPANSCWSEPVHRKLSASLPPLQLDTRAHDAQGVQESR